VCKKSNTNSQPFVKKRKKFRSPGGGGGLTHTVVIALSLSHLFKSLITSDHIFLYAAVSMKNKTKAKIKQKMKLHTKNGDYTTTKVN